MKACPTCQRTYADNTLTFCLVDGSILSASYDPHETLHLPAPRITDPSPAPPPPSTIQSTPAPPFHAEPRQPQLREKPGVNRWKALGIAMTLFGIVAVGAIVSLVWFGKDNAAENQSNSNAAKTSVLPAASPTATMKESRWGPRNEQASINEGERLTYYPGTTPEQCQADCDGNPRCQAFTYIRAGSYNPSDPPMCYLMSKAEKLTPSPCCISAIKR